MIIMCAPYAEPSLGHDFVVVPEKRVYGTCLTNGTIVERCSKCGEERTTVETARGFHNWVRETFIDATCISEGSITYECDLCHERKTETIPKKTEHRWVLNEDRRGLKECADCHLTIQDYQAEQEGTE